MGTQQKLTVLAMLVLAVAGLGAQGTATLVRQGQSVHFNETLRPANAASETKIVGRITDIRKMPVAHVKLQLRNLIDVRKRSDDDAGAHHPGATCYVVEMVLQRLPARTCRFAVRAETLQSD
jgi:hypothetical protein